MRLPPESLKTKIIFDVDKDADADTIIEWLRERLHSCESQLEKSHTAAIVEPEGEDLDEEAQLELFALGDHGTSDEIAVIVKKSFQRRFGKFPPRAPRDTRPSSSKA